MLQKFVLLFFANRMTTQLHEVHLKGRPSFQHKCKVSLLHYIHLHCSSPKENVEAHLHYKMSWLRKRKIGSLMWPSDLFFWIQNRWKFILNDIYYIVMHNKSYGSMLNISIPISFEIKISSTAKCCISFFKHIWASIWMKWSSMPL